ncbi:hypothetical protein HAZT_HAZT012227, partial [Hyalella azteca]
PSNYSASLNEVSFDKFWDSSLYRNVTILVWDPLTTRRLLTSGTNLVKFWSLQWYQRPDFDFFPEYFRRRLMLPHERLHLLHPASMWRLWGVMQAATHTRLHPNPPSSGFLGLVLMLHRCRTLHAVELLPSLRLTPRCHYWRPGDNLGCTYGEWHPLATEKLLIMLLNEASDTETYLKGYVTLRGFGT